MPRADRIGVAGSMLCATQCMTGAALAGVPAAQLAVFGEPAELGLAVLTALVTGTAIATGFRQHRQPGPVVAAGAAVAALAGARLFEFPHAGVEVALSIMTAALSIAAHVLNWRALREARPAAVAHACSSVAAGDTAADTGTCA